FGTIKHVECTLTLSFERVKENVAISIGEGIFRKMSQWKSLHRLFLAEPWLLWFPYLFSYLVGLALNLPVPLLRAEFCLLHLFTLWVGGTVLRDRFRSMSNQEKVLAALLIAFLFLPGAYLEYPSDTWEHFRRIFAWTSVSKMREYSLAGKFYYFWEWSFLS